MAKKVLITGTCGFIYSNVVLDFLQKTDYELISVDKLTSAGSLLNISHNPDVNIKRHKFYLGDVADYDFIAKVMNLEKPDIVVNGAASSHVDDSIKGSQEFVSSNIIGTHSMLEAIRNVHTPEKFIQAGTDEEYGQITEGSFVEDDPLKPRNPYSATKAAASLLCQSYIQTYDLPIIITRTCNVYGTRQHPQKLIPKAITNILQMKDVPVYGKGKQVREWIFVKDVCRALETIIEVGRPGEVYNIGSGFEITNIDLVRTIMAIMNAGRVEFVQDRLGHDFRYALDSSKLRALGWEPKYEFREALEHVISWYTKNRWSWNR